jgi:hypothetical protein
VSCSGFVGGPLPPAGSCCVDVVALGVGGGAAATNRKVFKM